MEKKGPNTCIKRETFSHLLVLGTLAELSNGAGEEGRIGHGRRERKVENLLKLVFKENG